MPVGEDKKKETETTTKAKKENSVIVDEKIVTYMHSL